MKRERVRSKHGFKGFGTFILGWFIGFICTILIIAGVGYWAYTSISVKKIEKWTKTNIAGDNKGLRNLTLQDAVNIAMGIAKGSDEYTLAKFEEDFDLKIFGDSLYGISLDKLKNSPIKEFKTAINETIDSATFNNILSFMDVNEENLGLLKKVLDGEVVYYINDNKLCTEENDASTEVEFDYTIEGSTVKFSNTSHTISSGKISPRFRDLPLSTAMTSMTDATKGLKIYEILEYHYDTSTEKYYQDYSNGIYSNPVSGVMGAIAGYTIDDLADQSKINELKIHEVMGYYLNETDGDYYTTSTFEEGTKVSGVMNSIAGKTLGDLSNQETFDNLYIYQVMGYTRVQISSEPIDYKYTDGNGDVTGIMSTIAGKTISQLDDAGAFNDVVVADALGYYKHSDGTYYTTPTFDEGTEVTGVIAHLAGSKISSLSADIKTLSLGKILGVEKGAEDNSTIINALYNSTIETLNSDIKTLKLGEMLGIEKGATGNSAVIDALYDSTIESLNQNINNLTLGSALGVDLSSATGVIKVLHDTKITELNTAMGELKVYQAMGYYYDEPNNKYYNKYDKDTETYSEEVVLTGIMKAIANTKVNELTTTIDTLKAKDVFSVENTPVLKLFIKDYGKANEDRTELNNLNIMDLPNKVVDKLNSADTKIGVLIDAGIINRTDIAEDDPVRNLTISSLIDLALQYS